jgi:hypothetical protein
MSFIEREKTILKPRRTGADRLDDFLNSLPEAEKETAIRIIFNASQKKVMDAFRDEGFPISYVTLSNWKDKNSGLQR